MVRVPSVEGRMRCHHVCGNGTRTLGKGQLSPPGGFCIDKRLTMLRKLNKELHTDTALDDILDQLSD